MGATSSTTETSTATMIDSNLLKSMIIPNYVNIDTFLCLFHKFGWNESHFYAYCDSDELISRELILKVSGTYDCYLYYEVGSIDNECRLIEDRVDSINEQLLARNLVTWFDKIEEAKGLLHHRIPISEKKVLGIKRSQCVLLFLTEKYMNKVTTSINSCEEMDYLTEFRSIMSDDTVRSIIPVIMDSSIRDSRSWDSYFFNLLGTRLKIDMSDYETNKTAKMNDLYDLILANIKRRICDGGDSNKKYDWNGVDIYSLEGRLLSWLKRNTYFDKETIVRYGKLLSKNHDDNGICSMLRFFQRTQTDDNYFTNNYGIPKVDNDIIMRALNDVTQCSVQGDNSINRMIGVEKVNRQQAAEETTLRMHEKVDVTNERLESNLMALSDNLSRYLSDDRTTSTLIDSHTTIDTNEQQFVAVSRDYFSRLKSMLDNDLQEHQERERCALLEKMNSVDRIFDASIILRHIELSASSCNYKAINCDKLLEDARAAFSMFIRLLNYNASMQDELIQSGSLSPLLSLLRLCIPYHEDRHQSLTAVSQGLLALKMACRLSDVRKGNGFCSKNVAVLRSLWATAIFAEILVVQGDTEVVVCSGMMALAASTCETGDANDLITKYKLGTSLVVDAFVKKYITADSLAAEVDSQVNMYFAAAVLEIVAVSLNRWRDNAAIVECGCEVFVNLITCSIISRSRFTKLIKTWVKLLADLSNNVASVSARGSCEWLLYTMIKLTTIYKNSASDDGCSNKKYCAFYHFFAESFGALHVFDALANILTIHSHDVSILELAFILLGNLVAFNSNNMLLCHAANLYSKPIRYIVKTHYRNHFQVTSSCCYFFSSLLRSCSATLSDFVVSLRSNVLRSITEDTSIIEHIVVLYHDADILELAIDDRVADMYVNSLSLIARLIEYGNKTVHDRVMVTGICEKLIYIFRVYGHIRNFYLEAIKAVMYVARFINEAYDAKNRLAETGVCEIIYQRMVIHRNDEELVACALATINAMTHECPSNAQLFQSFGIADFLKCNETSTVSANRLSVYADTTATIIINIDNNCLKKFDYKHTFMRDAMNVDIFQSKKMLADDDDTLDICSAKGVE